MKHIVFNDKAVDFFNSENKKILDNVAVTIVHKDILEQKGKEIERLKKALEDIQTILIKKQKAKGLCNQLLNVQEKKCLDIVNKALGSDI